ncbi:MAG TPA: AAA family ATPase, partial [Saprospiraceae bacterium]|nr:AAA family ATPase [Saprospiraceae bacterium]
MIERINNPSLHEDESNELDHSPLQEVEVTIEVPEDDHAEVREKLSKVIKECNKLVIGQDEIIELMLICLVCEGHILLEGVPGVAKTLAAKTFAKTIQADFSRIQFTPDLMPSDIIGTS